MQQADRRQTSWHGTFTYTNIPITNIQLQHLHAAVPLCSRSHGQNGELWALGTSTVPASSEILQEVPGTRTSNRFQHSMHMFKLCQTDHTEIHRVSWVSLDSGFLAVNLHEGKAQEWLRDVLQSNPQACGILLFSVNLPASTSQQLDTTCWFCLKAKQYFEIAGPQLGHTRYS